MKEKWELRDILALMVFLNLSAVGFYALICLNTTSRICASFEAYSFLSSVRQLPAPPWKTMSLS